MTQKKMVQPGIGRYQEELTRNKKGKTVGRKERLETSKPSTYKMERMLKEDMKRNFVMYPFRIVKR
jgi:hypothetical protein